MNPAESDIPRMSSESPLSPNADRSAGQYVVVARRYRPQSFEQLVGQGHIAQGLAGAINSDRVGHAYLFTGARGVGKTSAARIMAKALNCVEGPTVTPCGECDICERVSAGDDVDVLEIDGASNRGIDEIRELRQNATVRPSRARYKIYIIDEVHMLTREAFNALLKTLEEPPEHVKFIFCTTEPEKIPVTILSRCQRFDFAGIRTEDIAERLREIVQSEGVAAESEAIGLLARRAAGSMRDSQSLLEQLLSFGHDTISVADVHRLLGTADDRLLQQIVAHVADHNAAAAIETLDEAVAAGVDVGQLLGQLLGYLRDVLVVSAGCSEKLLLYVAADQIDAMRALAQRLGTDNVTAMMQIVDTTLARLRYSTYSRTLAELALVRLARLEDLEKLSDVIGRLAGGESPPDVASRPKPTQSAPKKKPSVTIEPPRAETAPPRPSESTTPAASPQPVGEATSDETPPPGDDANFDAAEDWADEVWEAAQQQLTGLIGDHARFASRVAVDGDGNLVIFFAPRYNLARTYCERPEPIGQLAEAVSSAAGRRLRVRIAVDDSAGADDEAETAAADQVSRREDALENPLVLKAAELFEARPIRVDEPE